MKTWLKRASIGLALVSTLAASAYAQYSSDFRYDPNRTHSTEAIQNLQMLSPEQRVDTALWLLKGVSDTGPRIAAQILMAERPEYVVQKIVDAIRFDPLFEDADRRRYAFVVLAAKQDWPNPDTYELLVDGLIDFRVENVCRIGLEQPPEARRSQAALTMARRLEDWYQAHGPATGVILEILGGYGGAAMVAAPMVERIFLAPGNPWPQNRSAAAKTLAQIGGLAMAVDKYKRMDTIQYAGALDGLAWLAELSPSPYASDAARTQQARQIVLDALAVPAVSVVRVALPTLPLVYGEALYTNAQGIQVLNPDVKAGLISGAEKQADPMLRSVLVTALRQYEAAAANQ